MTRSSLPRCKPNGPARVLCGCSPRSRVALRAICRLRLKSRRTLCRYLSGGDSYESQTPSFFVATGIRSFPAFRELRNVQSTHDGVNNAELAPTRGSIRKNEPRTDRCILAASAHKRHSLERDVSRTVYTRQPLKLSF